MLKPLTCRVAGDGAHHQMTFPEAPLSLHQNPQAPRQTHHHNSRPTTALVVAAFFNTIMTNSVTIRRRPISITNITSVLVHSAYEVPLPPLLPLIVTISTDDGWLSDIGGASGTPAARYSDTK